jgi:chromosomal replication initiation ATPase DnaA
MEHEVAERARRRTARHLLEARLPAGKTLDCFDFTAVTSISKARVTALAEGDSWLDQGTNILLFGPPGVGKSHLAAALGHAMIDAGYRVLFTARPISSSNSKRRARNSNWRPRSKSSTNTICLSSTTCPTSRRVRRRPA